MTSTWLHEGKTRRPERSDGIDRASYQSRTTTANTPITSTRANMPRQQVATEKLDRRRRSAIVLDDVGQEVALVLEGRVVVGHVADQLVGAGGDVGHVEADAVDVGLQGVEVEVEGLRGVGEQDLLHVLVGYLGCRDEGSDLAHVAVEARLEVRVVDAVHGGMDTDVEARQGVLVG